MGSWPVEIDPVFGCHVWVGKLNDRGRPIIWVGRKPLSAVRHVFESDVRPLGDDEVPDHLCRNIRCINVLHLEPVTRRENEMRKSWAFRCRRKVCPQGHPMKNPIVTPDAGLLCRECAKSR